MRSRKNTQKGYLMVQLWENVERAAIGMTTAEDLGHGLTQILQRIRNKKLTRLWQLDLCRSRTGARMST
jgi:hypothetical protein